MKTKSEATQYTIIKDSDANYKFIFLTELQIKNLIKKCDFYEYGLSIVFCKGNKRISIDADIIPKSILKTIKESL